MDRTPLWTLDEALLLVRHLEDAVVPHFHVALGGSVLIRGWSDKDVDVVIYPHNKTRASPPAEDLLQKAGLTVVFNSTQMRKKWGSEYGTTDTKSIERWDWKGRRVDIFFLS